MEKINTISELKLRIAYLEGEKKVQEVALKEALRAAQEQIRPANLIKSAVKDLFSSGAGSSLLDGALGMASGSLAKNLVTGSLGGPVRFILGKVLQAVVTEKVAEHAKPLREKIITTLREFLSKNQKPG